MRCWWLSPRCGSEPGEKGSRCGFILRVDLPGFADGWVTGYEGEESRMIPRFFQGCPQQLAGWTAITEIRSLWVKQAFGGKIRYSLSGM